MRRVTVSLDDDLMTDLDRIIERRGYQNRSEAIRDLARAGIQQATEDAGKGRECVGALFFVYDHATRDLAKRLIRTSHDRHDLTQATLHVHLDHGHCMEVTVLKGRTADVRQFADSVIVERGVRYGRVVMLPAELATGAHAHSNARAHRHSHAHVRQRR
jgi:CopG family transcriptional regulator, nickel-responsive regulator